MTSFLFNLNLNTNIFHPVVASDRISLLGLSRYQPKIGASNFKAPRTPVSSTSKYLPRPNPIDQTESGRYSKNRSAVAPHRSNLPIGYKRSGGAFSGERYSKFRR